MSDREVKTLTAMAKILMVASLIVALAAAMLLVSTLMSRPARAAMEPEEIMVRLATGLPPYSRHDRRKTRRIRHGR